MLKLKFCDPHSGEKIGPKNNIILRRRVCKEQYFYNSYQTFLPLICTTSTTTTTSNNNHNKERERRNDIDMAQGDRREHPQTCCFHVWDVDWLKYSNN